MSVVQTIRTAAAAAIKALYEQAIPAKDIAINTTKPEFEGEYTILVFPFTKFSKLKPEETGEQLGKYLSANFPDLVAGYNVIKGFLNLQMQEQYWSEYLQQHFNNRNIG